MIKLFKESLRVSIESRNGMTVIEVMIAILISMICAITLIYITTLKISAQEDVDNQATLVSVNGFFSEIYKEFKKSDTFEVQQEDDGSYMSVTFVNEDGKTVIYSFSDESGEMRRNNIPVFRCLTANATKTANNLYISVKIADSRLLELNVYK